MRRYRKHLRLPRTPSLRIQGNPEVRLREAFAGPYAGLPVAVLAVDGSGRILGANRRFHEMLGLDPLRTSGTPDVAEIISAAGLEQWSSAAGRALDGGPAVEFTQELLRDGSSPFRVSVTMKAALAANGQADHVLVAIADIDAQEREAAGRRAAMDAAAEELRSRNEFQAVVVHEIKNGLTGMAGFAEMIRDFDLEPATIKDYAGDILNDAHRMSRMLAELLELARLESGQLRLHADVADLNGLISSQVRCLAAARARVYFEAGPIPPVHCDPDRTIQVISNLLSNALKYSPNGGEITITSSVSGSMAAVRVRDRGLGIPPEEVGGLFERFHRVEKGDAGKITGTGLGLAVSREIVLRQGGQMTVESTYGEGSTFSFTIPLAAAGRELSVNLQQLEPEEDAK